MNLQCLLFPPLTSPRHSGFSQLLSALKQLILKLKTWGAASDNDHLTIICWHFQKKCFFWFTPHKTVHVDMSRLSDYLDIPGFHSLAEFSRRSKRGKLQLNDVWKLRVYRVYFFPHSHHLDIPGFTSYPPPSSWYWSWKREVPQAIKWSFDNCLHFRNLFLLAPTSQNCTCPGSAGPSDCSTQISFQLNMRGFHPTHHEHAASPFPLHKDLKPRDMHGNKKQNRKTHHHHRHRHRHHHHHHHHHQKQQQKPPPPPKTGPHQKVNNLPSSLDWSEIIKHQVPLSNAMEWRASKVGQDQLLVTKPPCALRFQVEPAAPQVAHPRLHTPELYKKQTLKT